MPNPDQLETDVMKDKIIALTVENDRLRRRIYLLETLLGDMLEDRLKSPPRRRTTKTTTA